VSKKTGKSIQKCIEIPDAYLDKELEITIRPIPAKQRYRDRIDEIYLRYSELAAAIALRQTLPEFLSDSSQNSIFKKFIIERVDINRSEGLQKTSTNRTPSTQLGWSLPHKEV
jgi:hypothetical protein